MLFKRGQESALFTVVFAASILSAVLKSALNTGVTLTLPLDTTGLNLPFIILLVMLVPKLTINVFALPVVCAVKFCSPFSAPPVPIIVIVLEFGIP